MASLPWGHNLVLLHKLKHRETRLWYAKAALHCGWSRTVLDDANRDARRTGEWAGR